jgi:ferredoxin
MSAQVIVLKRFRRRRFEVLWLAPLWVRSVAASWRRLHAGASLGGAEETIADQPLGGAWGASSARRSRTGTAIPGLVWSASGTHRCVGCGRCVEVCPSRAIAIESDEERYEVASVRRFELRVGACIGCGECAEVCPESALLLGEGADRVGPGPEPARRGIVDLLRASE